MTSLYNNSTTEERVVEMQIDNKKFEKGAKTTISTLEKLEKALNIKSSTKAIDDLADSISRFDASPMEDSFTTAFGNISAKGVVIARLISDLTHDIYTFAKRTVKELTIDQISAGMDKYTNLAEAQQMIIAATADEYTTEEEQLEAVEEVLKRILFYSDETSYNFTDMVSSIGKLVNNGVSLEDALKVVMGFSSAAAASGADAKKASHALEYSITQAYGVGTMKSQDWKTLETLNIASTELKKNAIAVAAEMGKIRSVTYLDDETTQSWTSITDPSRFDELGNVINMTKGELNELFTERSFREGLTSGWFDNDVQTELWKRYGEFSSVLYEVSELTGEGASNVLEMLDMYRDPNLDVNWDEIAKQLTNDKVTAEELKAALEELNQVKWSYGEKGFRMGQEYKTWKDVIGYVQDAVSTQWMQTFKLIFGNFLEAKELWSEVGGIMEAIFVSGGRLRNEILEVWKANEGRDALIDSFRNIVTIISNIVSPIKNIVMSIFGLDSIESFGERLAELTKKFRNFTKLLADFTGGEMPFKNFIASLNGVKTPIVAIIGALGLLATKFLAIKTFTSTVATVKMLLTGLLSPFGRLSLLISGIIYLWNNWNKLTEYVKTNFQALSPIIEKIEKRFSALKDVFKNASFQNGLASLVDKVKGLFTFNGQTGKTIIDWLLNLFNNIAEHISKWKTNAKSLGDFLGSMFSDLFAVLSQVSAKDWWNTFKQPFVDLFEPVTTWLADSLERIKPYFTETWQGFINFILGLLGRDTDTIIENSVSEATKDFLDPNSMANAINNVDWNKVATKGVSALGTAVGTQLLGSFGHKEEIEQVYDSVVTPMLAELGITSIEDAAGMITRSLESQEVGDKPTFGQWILSKMPFTIDTIKDVLPFDVDRLVKDVDSINWKQVLDKALDIAGLITSIRALRGLTKVENSFAKFVKTFTKGFKNVDFQQFLNNITSPLTALKEMFTKELPGLFSSVKSTLRDGFKIKHEYKKVDSLGTTLLKIAAAIAILAGVVYLITKIDINKAYEALKMLGIMLGGLFLFSTAFKIAKIDGKPILRMAIGIALLMIPLRMIAKMKLADIAKGLIAIGVLLAELSFFTRLGSKNNYSRDNTVPFIKMAFALLVLITPLKKIGKMDWESIMKGLVGIGALLFELSLAMKFMGNGVVKGNATPFIKMAIAVLILSLVMKGIAKLNYEELAKGLISVLILLFSVAGAMRLMKNVGKVKGILALVIAIGVLVLVMKQINKMSLGEILKGVIVIGILLRVLSRAFAAAKGMTFGSSIATLLVLAGSIAILVFAFNYLNEQQTDFKNLLTFAKSLTLVMAAFGFMMKSMKGISFGAGIQAIGLFALFIVALGGILTALGWIESQFEGFTKFIYDGADMFAAFGDAIGRFVGGIVSGVTGAIFGDFSLPKLGEDLSAFSTNVQPFVESMKTVDSSVLSGAGNLAGAVIAIAGAEFIDRVLSFLGSDLVGKFCLHLAMLGQAIKSYSISVKGVEDASTSASNAETIMGGLITLITRIAGAEWLTWFLGDNVSAFSSQAQLLAQGLVDYATKIKGLTKVANILDIGTSVLLAESLGTLLGSLSREGGAFDWLTGTKTEALENFGKGVGILGGGLAIYAGSITGIHDKFDPEDVKAANETAVGLKALQDSLPETGGLVQKILGWSDLGTFGTGIEALGDGLKKYCDAIDGIAEKLKDGDLEAAKKAAAGLAGLQNSLPETGGALQSFIGEQNLATFGSQLFALGGGLKLYSIAINNISKWASEDDLALALSTGQNLSALNDSLPRSGGGLQDFIGNKNLKTFGTDIKYVGEGLMSYAKSIQDISTACSYADLQRATGTANGLAALNNALPTTGGMWQLLVTGEKDLNAFAGNIEVLGASLKSFATNVNGIEDVNTGAALGVLTEISEFVNALDTEAGFVKAIKKVFTGDKWGELRDTLLNMGTFGRQFGAFRDGIKGAAGADGDFATATQIVRDFIALGSEYTDPDGQDMYMNAYTKALEVPQALADGLSENSMVYYDAIISLINGSAVKFDALATEAHTGGWNVSAGIANGITDGSFMPLGAIQILVDSIMSGFSDPLLIESPSRAMAALAWYIPAGIAQGINQNESVAIDSIGTLSNDMLIAMQRAMYDVGMMADSDFTFQPTIMPVIDMTNAREAGSAINDMFSSANVKTMFDSANIDGATITRSIQDKDLVTEIRSINDHLSVLDQSMQNMQIVLDTGMLVGGIATKMDNKLGVMSARKGRGN